jgi:hypothetical protein
MAQLATIKTGIITKKVNPRFQTQTQRRHQLCLLKGSSEKEENRRQHEIHDRCMDEGKVLKITKTPLTQ